MTIPPTLPIPEGFRMLKDDEVLQLGTRLWLQSSKQFLPIYDYDNAVAVTPTGRSYRLGSVYHTDNGLPGIIASHVEPVYVVPERVTIREKESISVLRECMDLQIKKSNDYQNPNSRIRQADYYPNGIKTILDVIHAKTLRLYSVLEAMESDPNYQPNFESIEDSGKDLINYSSFLVAYSRGGIDGQLPDRDFLNRKIAA